MRKFLMSGAFRQYKREWLTGGSFALLEVVAVAAAAAGGYTLPVYLGLFVLFSFCMYVVSRGSKRNLLAFAGAALLWLSGLVCWGIVVSKLVTPLFWAMQTETATPPLSNLIQHTLSSMDLRQVYAGGWFIGILCVEFARVYRKRHKLLFVFRIISVPAVPVVFAFILNTLMIPSAKQIADVFQEDSPETTQCRKKAERVTQDIENPVWTEAPDTVTLPLRGYLAVKRDSKRVLLFGISELDEKQLTAEYSYIVLDKTSDTGYRIRSRGEGKYSFRFSDFSVSVSDGFTVDVFRATTLRLDRNAAAYGFLPPVSTEDPAEMMQNVRWHHPLSPPGKD